MMTLCDCEFVMKIKSSILNISLITLILGYLVFYVLGLFTLRGSHLLTHLSDSQ